MIGLENLTKKYGAITALDNISLDIGEGEFVSLVGPSGAGKSTLIRLLICAEQPTEGKIFIAGREITRLSREQIPYYRRKIGVIWQDYKLLHSKTVWENVAFAMEVSDVPYDIIKKRVPAILELVGLGERFDNFPSELSGGEQQRVSIARALVHQPKLLIADEPTGNLDPRNAMDVIHLLLKINNGGTTVLLATHNKDAVNALKKRVVTLDSGKITYDQKVGKYLI